MRAQGGAARGGTAWGGTAWTQGGMGMGGAGATASRWPTQKRDCSAVHNRKPVNGR
ncbi:hypothetical protein PSA01_20720 [Pseudonocardia saturnea]|uniref:Uncharacterized protein n=1 Tax=Pseudonocardia saturnea TaxID=33909 RepID=A0ABQ0RWL7_9PSEU|nr:hypothetical protein Pdca_11930 [Pseudonocardia autotrophica]GEC25043.1 hypothetical protein PSA01_20720 [Pseudonocardia saturnea]